LIHNNICAIIKINKGGVYEKIVLDLWHKLYFLFKRNDKEFDMEYALQVENLHKKIKNNSILTDINLNIKYGESMGLIGPNGAGKTSLIKCMSGLWNYDCGKVLICGSNIKTNFKSAMENSGFIIEYPRLFSELTPITNIEYISAYYNKHITRKEIENIISDVKLEKEKNKKVKTFSSGMYQRVCLALLIVRKPEILILDEPTAMLDPKSIIDFRNILINIKKNYGISMLISSHNLNEVEKLCDRVAIIEKGNMLKIEELNNINTKKYNITFSNEDDTKSAAKLLSKEISYSTTQSNLFIVCTITQFKQFMSTCPYEIEDFKIGDLEGEFLSAIKGDQL